MSYIVEAKENKKKYEVIKIVKTLEEAREVVEDYRTSNCRCFMYSYISKNKMTAYLKKKYKNVVELCYCQGGREFPGKEFEIRIRKF